MTDAIATKREFPEGLDVSRMSVVSAFFEDCVRDMVIAGAEWLDENPDASPQFGRVHGSDEMTAVNAAGSLMRLEMLKAASKRSTAEMLRIAVNNVRAIRILGWTRYIQDLQEGRWF